MNGEVGRRGVGRIAVVFPAVEGLGVLDEEGAGGGVSFLDDHRHSSSA